MNRRPIRPAIECFVVSLCASAAAAIFTLAAPSAYPDFELPLMLLGGVALLLASATFVCGIVLVARCFRR